MVWGGGGSFDPPWAVTVWVGRREEKQIPSGKDRKKCKGNCKCKSQYRGLSTALRFGRDDEGYGATLWSIGRGLWGRRFGREDEVMGAALRSR